MNKLYKKKGGEASLTYYTLPSLTPQYKLLLQFAICLIILIITGVTFNKIAFNDNIPFSKSTFNLYLTVVLVLFFVFIVTLKYGSIGETRFNKRLLINIIIGIIVLIILFFAYGYLNKIATKFLFYTISFILICIIIVGLSIAFNIFHNNLLRGNNSPLLKFIVEFVFFIPCLLNDFIKYILEQLNLTPNVTYVLLFIELLLILAYVYLPYYLKKITSGNGVGGKLLQKESHYLNTGKSLVIATVDDLGIKNEDILNINKKNPFHKNYGFSMWININPQNISTNEVPIFYYGSKITKNKVEKNEVKPYLTYSYDNETNKDTYNIYFSTITTTPTPSTNMFKIHVPNQRWNHFFFNYNDNNMDLYVNGILVRTKVFTNENMPVYDSTDQVVIGNETVSGLNGSICDVTYFSSPISPFEIATLYNMGNSLTKTFAIF